MKKLFLSALLLMGISVTGFSQLALVDSASVPYKNGDTIFVTGNYPYQLSAHVYSYDSSLTINTNIYCFPQPDTVNKSTYSECVGATCYPAKPIGNAFKTPTFKVPVGRDTNALFFDYNPAAPGVTIVRYDFRNSLVTDSAWIYVKFDATPTSVQTIVANNMHVSALFPNPANTEVSFTYRTNYTGTLDIYNSLGQLVKTMTLPSSKENTIINTTDMASGIYICKVEAAGAQPAFRKLVVSH